jgi:DNA-binding NtrC family response regulator
MREFNKNFNKNILNITKEVLSQLMQHTWPGNVRELENVMERAFVITEGDTIDTIFLSHDIQNNESLNALPGTNIDIPFKVARAMVEKQFEKTYLSQALERYEGNVTKTAKETGINPRTLWRKIKKHELERGMFIAPKTK